MFLDWQRAGETYETYAEPEMLRGENFPTTFVTIKACYSSSEQDLQTCIFDWMTLSPISTQLRCTAYVALMFVQYDNIILHFDVVKFR